ncbi:serine/threonine protein kinase [Amycolatopsis coloradensis]|uniref:non-specific serine/threonine protein kinase n=1 Tax=Amycolatopsis coloradensis TaxID=76021 RepID=A0A1R0KPH2_9PSEU|nr:serine/threonine-protein kinase [Amycolatopsis coloradensis]OLZ49072.1 serine/threonine protein kinase [Amycolatopsis coloradensis]
MSSEGSIVGGRYRLDQPIGRGRAGIVWLAFDTRLLRTVAMKRMYLPVGLPPDRAEQAKAVVIQEGKDAAKFEHATAIKVYDVLPDGPDVWLVMEYIPSRGMATFLAEHGRLTPEQAAALGIMLGRALAAMHEAGVVHRTVEPGTVLLADDGGVKLTDIGITGGGATPAYRAPEVARGEPATSASDVFSLGATLYTAVEGVPPFGEDGESSERPPQTAGPLAGALRKMLRAEPDVRPTMADTVRSLGAITEGRQTAFIPPTAPAMPTMPASMPVPMPMQQAPQQPVPPFPQHQPPQQFAPPQQQQQYAPAPAAAKASDTRKWLITAGAVVAAILIGALFAELFLI